MRNFFTASLAEVGADDATWLDDLHGDMLRGEFIRQRLPGVVYPRTFYTDLDTSICKNQG